MAKGPTRKPGLLSLAIDLWLIGYGLWYFIFGETRTAIRGTIAGIGLVLGVISLLYHIARAIGAAQEPHEAAESMVALNKALYADQLEYAPADLSTFPRVDHGYYDQTQRWLEGHGFRCLGDFEVTSLTRAMPSMRTFLRVMLSADATIMAAVYDVKPCGFMRLLQLLHVLDRDFRTLDLATEFADGTFLATSNAKSASLTQETPGITRAFVPLDAGLEAVLNAHRSELARSAVPPKSHASVEEVFASQARSHALKAAHRKREGYVNVEEIERIAGRPLTAAHCAAAEEAERLGAPEAALPDAGTSHGGYSLRSATGYDRASLNPDVKPADSPLRH